MISLNYENSLSKNIGREGITKDKLEHLTGTGFKNLEQIKKDKPGFMKLPFRFDVAKKIKEDAKSYRKFNNIVILGIGGSALGNITLYSMLNHPYHNIKKPQNLPRFFAVDNVDPAWVKSLEEIIDPEETLFNVITKSGGTAETLSNFFYFLEKLKDKTENWREHLVFTTGKEGFLREFSRKEDIATYSIPEDVGGRYSVLSEVGLFPAAVCGIDIEQLLEGAADAEEEERFPVEYAALQYYFFKKSKNINVFMPYSKKLERTADWFRQLWAESLGKNKHIGPTPVKALGTTDQHSQVQLYMEGPNDKFITFLSVRQKQPELELVYDDHFLSGKSMRDLFNAELKGTQKALTQVDRPSVNIKIPKIDAYNAGELLYQLEKACCITGYMFGVDPFNQPGVELGKKLAYEILEKEDRE
ncbi:MAG: glucose-6-phosphate isomerase [Elusimicrobiota bacterium]